MGFVFQGGIEVNAGFAVNSPVSQDMYGIVETRQDLNLPSNGGVFGENLRYLCRTVIVLDERLEYWLKNGLTDADWEVKGAVSDTILPVWSQDTDYVEGQIVWQGGTLWRAAATHTSTDTGTFDDDVAYWESASADTFTTAATLAAFGNIPAGTNLDNLTFAEMMEMQVNPDIPGTLALTASPAFGLRERGDAVAGIDLNFAYGKTKYPLADLTVYQNAVEVDFEDTTGTLDANGGTYISNPADLDGTSNVTFRGVLADSEGLESEASGSYTFTNPIWIGYLPGTVNAANATEADVISATMQKRVVLRSNQTVAYTVTLSKFAIWAPDDWGSPRILDQNGFDNTNSFESAPLMVENLAGENVPGRLFIARNVTSQTAFTMHYNFS